MNAERNLPLGCAAEQGNQREAGLPEGGANVPGSLSSPGIPEPGASLGGEPVPPHPINHDITQRKRAEQALKESEARFAKVFHAAPIGIGISSLVDDRFIDINESFLRICGYERDEVIQHTSAELGLWVDLEHRQRVVRTLMTAGRLQNLEMKFRHKSGRVGDLLASGERIELSGTPCFLVMFYDITEMRQAERTVRKLSQAVEQSSAGVLITDLQGVIEYANPRYCRITGYTPGELIGRNPRIFKSGHTTLEEYRRIWRKILAGEDWTGEFLNKKKDGSLFWERVILSPVKDEAGQTTHFLAVKEDVSEQKRVEMALQTSSEQLRALAGRLQSVREEERARIAREIHDVLAQELTCLKMDLVWVGRRLTHPQDMAGQGALRDEVDRMVEVTNRIVESVQRIATDLRPVVLDTLGLCAAVEWLAQDFQNRTGLTFETRVPARFSLDHDHSTALFRILQESLTNVVRHASANRVEIRLEGPPNLVTLTIRDNGCGMTADRIEDPHSIGLLGMRERALLLGGHCEVISQPQQGTTVQVQFPVAPDASQPKPA